MVLRVAIHFPPAGTVQEFRELSRGDPRVAAGAGALCRELGLPLQRRLLAYTLLHRYSNLRWYLERMPDRDGITTLDALAGRWWAVGDEPEIAAP
jgi:hypothetical protein